MFTFQNERRKDQICDRAIAEIAAGRPDALTVVYRTYGRLILSVAHQIVQHAEDAEDVLQTVMLKILQKASSYQIGTNPRAWILTITRNAALDLLKRRQAYFSLDEWNDAQLPDSLVDRSFARGGMIEDALRLLTAEEQLTVKLKLYAGLSHSEVAEVLNVTESCAQKRYERALKKLRNYFCD